MFLIIDLADIPQNQKHLVNQAFNIWKETYTDILAQSGETLSVDYFFRCRILTMLVENDLVEAILLHNMYDLSVQGVADLTYFQPARTLIDSGVIKKDTKIFSCEWVTVRDDMRNKGTGLIMMGTAFKAFLDSGCDAAMGFSRTDNGADRMAEMFGFEKLGLITRHDKECGVMFLPVGNLKSFPKKSIQAEINSLYEQRLNFSTLITQTLERKAS